MDVVLFRVQLGDRKYTTIKIRGYLIEKADCSPPGSSVHGILQARILEWVAMPFFPRELPDLGLLHYRQILYHLSHQGKKRET